ncbi:MAG TPA: SPOR domain-containing protein [Allosphingosinicella sp.]|jgi:hypothetical protein
MTDIRADDSPLEEDRLPWLEAVEDDNAGEGPSPMKMIMGVLIALVAIGAIVGGLFWMNNRPSDGAASGEPELIAAPGGDYKTKPENAGGMTVEGEGDTAFAASEGADPKGAINTNAMEAPVTKAPAQAAQPQPQQPAAQPKQEAPAPAAPAPAATGGATIQLGAFSSQAGANAAWKAMSGRFGYLAPLTQSVVPVQSGGKTLYRLRASGPNAADICGRLKVAGESCVRI